ncbi:hypothetical protein M413DRAFT_443254 [Hebeloma cylindrosporum]|uniref:Uncharacterized protein n=1 Tax=Hebeloma cylindrosporum TaxID=76867 RepID=A0A0C2Y320_HEBCY|nr:hypothetical protein M413DRAFT_443254 [Hebeloma cylindrosporum h7]
MAGDVLLCMQTLATTATSFKMSPQTTDSRHEDRIFRIGDQSNPSHWYSLEQRM